MIWGKTAEALAEYLKKGKQIFVNGKVQTRQWEDRDGSKKYTTEIRAERIVLLGGGERRRDDHVRDEDVGHGEPVAAGDGIPKSEFTADDIPF